MEMCKVYELMAVSGLFYLIFIIVFGVMSIIEKDWFSIKMGAMGGVIILAVCWLFGLGFVFIKTYFNCQ